METQTLATHLASVAADLTAAGPQTQALELARTAIARAALGGQAETMAASQMAHEAPPTPLEEGSALHAELNRIAQGVLTEAQGGAPPPPLVFRRQFPIATTLEAASLPSWADGRAISNSFGPFTDVVGREVWIDVFEPATFVAFVRAGSSIPFLLVQVQTPLPSATDRIQLTQGSIWLASALLAPGAPANGYTGLRITRGTLALGQTFTISPTVSVPPGVAFSLQVELASSAVPQVGDGPGGDARAMGLGAPDTATFIFEQTRTVVAEVGPAKLDVFGASLSLSRNNEAPLFELDLGRIAVPFSAEGPALTVTTPRSSLWSPSGTAPISSAAWSLPVATTAPGTLGEAAGAGGIRLRLAGGLSAHWEGQEAVASLGDCCLLADQGLLAVRANGATLAAVSQRIPLWSDVSRGTLELSFANAFPLTSISAAQGIEALILITAAQARLDRPLTVNNARLPLNCPHAAVALVQDTNGTTLVFAGTVQPPATPSPVAFAICNALMTSSLPQQILLAGQYGGDAVFKGKLGLVSQLYYLLPILPDPYAANLSMPLGRLREPRGLGQLLMLLNWAPSAEPTLDFLLPPDAGSLAAPLPPTPQPHSQLVAGGVLASSAERFSAAAGKAVVDRQHLAELAAEFDRTVGAKRGDLILLDISSNASWFGVQFASVTKSPVVGALTAAAPLGQTNVGAGAAGVGLVVTDMYLESRASNVRVITLPDVQWEPVIVREQLPPPSPPFPTPMTFADNGGPSELGVDSVELVRVAPKPAIDFLVAGYHRETNPLTVGARFTLPFGIVAFARLQRAVAPVPVFIPGPTLSLIRPDFPARNMAGGDQLRLGAARPLLPIPNQASPGLPGAAVQLYNGLYHGLPTGESVITPIDDTFNTNFAPGTLHPRVPVTSVDLSGYGESLASAWSNPADAAGIISKAQFNVFVGRTSLEVVQAYSVLYPYAIRVVRTITIERENGGEIVRHDSGWQPVSDGEYRYPVPAFGPPLITHPGVIRAARNVANIRDTGQKYTTTDGSELMAVRFDCNLDVEGVVLGGGSGGVPSRDQLGFVQLTDPTGRGVLGASEYAALVLAFAPLGGVIDCVVDIGGSGQQMRLTRVGVGTTPGMGGAEFVMAAWGSPLLPAGGQWSFAKQAPGDTPQPVDANLGVPLVRAGAAPNPPPPSNPYRFADPQDLATPDSPATDYGLLHATGSQRVLFPRPKVEAGAHSLTSAVSPLIADPYALAAAVGLFPHPTDCIPFPSASYQLNIGPNHALQLSPSPLSFTVTRPVRIISQAGSVSYEAFYADEHGNAANLTLAIDSAASVPWSFELTQMSLATNAGALGEVMRLVGDFKASAAAPTTIDSSRLVFGGALSSVQDILTLLKDMGFNDPLSVAVSNQWKVLVGLKIPITGAPGEPSSISIGVASISNAYVETSLSLTTSGGEALFTASALLLIATPFTPLMAAGLLYLAIDISSKTGTTFTLKIGAGLAIDAVAVGPFKLQVYVVVTQFFIVGDVVVGYGCGLLIKATLSLGVVSAYISVEGKMALLEVTCGAGKTLWGEAKLTLAIDITIAWVIDINISYSWQVSSNFDGGPCPLPSVV